jgi:hypothetical protein
LALRAAGGPDHRLELKAALLGIGAAVLPLAPLLRLAHPQGARLEVDVGPGESQCLALAQPKC